MSELILKPKKDYIANAKWVELYSLAEQWQNDIYFYKDELKFLNNLITKYFILMTKEKKLSDVQNMVTELSKLDIEQRSISNKIKKNLADLGLLIEHDFNNDQSKFRKDYLQCENELTKFIKALKKIKKELFKSTKQVVKSEKARHLLTS
jgi:hypothetical protein